MYGLVGLFNQALANEILLTLGLVVAEIQFCARLILLSKCLVDPLVKSSNSVN
jgi:hypothetical protein